MIRAISIVGQAFRLWWSEFLLLIFFNLAWLALQIPIITGPPATAAMYAIARHVANGEFLEPRHGLDALRQMFAPAWVWGAVNLLIVGVLVGNFWLYQSATGWLWTCLRLVWGVIALGWFSVNLFYWPFWLAQEQRSLRLTLRNSFLFLAKRPGLGLTLMLISSILIAVSVITTLPLAAALMAWLSLIGVLAVQEALSPRDEEDKIAVDPTP
jgi:uncharacterized membrane protein YesL